MPEAAKVATRKAEAACAMMNCEKNDGAGMFSVGDTSCYVALVGSCWSNQIIPHHIISYHQTMA